MPPIPKDDQACGTPVVTACLDRLGVSRTLYRQIKASDALAVSLLSPHQANAVVGWPDANFELEAVSAATPIRSGDLLLVSEQGSIGHVKDVVVRAESSGEGGDDRGRISHWTGTALIRAQEVWGPTWKGNELFLTSESLSFESSDVKARLTKGSYQLRLHHDPARGLAFSSLDYRIAKAPEGLRYDAEKRLLELNDAHLHIGDFALLRTGSSFRFDLVQVVQIQSRSNGGLKLKLRMLAMCRKDPEVVETAGHHQLFNYSEQAHRLMRRAHVLPLSQRTAWPRTDTFWTADESLSACGDCRRQWTERAQLEEDVVMSRSIRALDLFSGAGGLSIGLALSGNIKTKWAVDRMPAAASAFRTHHPNAAVHQVAVSKLIERLCSGDTSESEKLPQQGEVDLLVAGPPCQGFSTANPNRGQSSIDDKAGNWAIVDTLSSIEILLPQTLIIENVPAIGDENIMLGTKGGYPKLIAMALASLEYSFTFQCLEASSYGACIRRKRLFIIATRGRALPKLPEASHFDEGRRPQRQLLTIFHSNGVEREYLSPPFEGAPHLAVTAQDALTDLPPFDWMDPHVKCPRYPTQFELKKEARPGQGIPAVVCDSRQGVAGLPSPASYRTRPKTRYQAMMRWRCGSTVMQHQTPALSLDVVERVTNLLEGPNAGPFDWSEMGREFGSSKLCLLPDGLEQKSWQTDASHLRNSRHCYRRIDASQPFGNLTTIFSPNNRNVRLVHPEQFRMITYREAARAQGFPDWVELQGSASEKATQLGNAVPVMLAYTLGRAIIDSAVDQEVERRRQSAGGSGSQ